MALSLTSSVSQGKMNQILCIGNKEEWLGSLANIKGANKDAKI